MFWVDEIIEDILDRKDQKYLITDYKTPSGKIHVGALRGVIIHDVIYRGLAENNISVEYWYGFDDFDPMDGLASELKEKYEKYMGMPLCNIPSPKTGYKNFARYFADSFTKVFQSLGVTAKVIWGSELYKKGTYNKAIEIVLDNAEKIRRIYKEVSGGEKPSDWYPLNVVCPKCGKIGTTRVYDWDKKEVSFICEENMVDWAKGCGYKGKISPFDGNGKMPYKVETAAKWFTFKTSIEMAGKDHYTKGGTFYIAREIAREIFKIEPAYGYGYEWFLVGGKKMSTSKGIGASTEEIASVLPSEMLRFLMVRTRAKRAIDFDVNGDTIPLLYDEYDRCAQDLQNDSRLDTGRAFYFSKIDPNKDQPKYLLRFSKIAYMLQMPRVDIFEYAEKEKASVAKSRGAEGDEGAVALTELEKKEIEDRIVIAEEWLKNYAPENYKFTIQENLPEEAKKLSTEQKDFLAQVLEKIESRESWAGEDLHKEIHTIKSEMGISPREAFSAIYLTFIGKDSGPQAGWLLASLERNLVLKRLKEATDA